MGFYEDDRIRHKNKPKTESSEPTYNEYVILVDKSINIGEIISPLFKDYEITLLNDKKHISIKKKGE
jgi:hypothetical protein